MKTISRKELKQMTKEFANDVVDELPDTDEYERTNWITVPAKSNKEFIKNFYIMNYILSSSKPFYKVWRIHMIKGFLLGCIVTFVIISGLFLILYSQI